jgi:metal-responsive CopG/Arc/MetJ family transcriptional regulator
MKPAKKKLLVLQAETALIEGLDRIAARKMQSRSELCRQALLAALEKEGLVPLVAA